jgi:MerR family transcriptional regulator, copper efflux regulator
VSTYQIAEVAERSGFTAATLRYYEDIGLVPPPERSPAGYRLYDDAAVERLRFIARAKRLGCSLDEIAELARAWDGGECGPVQVRLRAMVEAKVAEAQARIAELATFTAELRRAAAVLDAHRPVGPCDDECGCTADGPPTPTRVSAPLVVEADGEGPPIACTLGPGDVAGRLADWRALLTGGGEAGGPPRGVTARLPLDDGVRLEFAPGTAVTEIARLAAAEQGCCRFFRFAIVIDDRGLALEVHASDSAADAVTALFGAPE